MENKLIIVHFSLFLFCLNIFANDSIELCFDEAVNLQSVKAYVMPILLANETIILKQEIPCMNVEIPKERVELLQKYIGMRYTIIRSSTSYSSNERLFNKNCKVIIIKTRALKDENNNIAIGQKSRFKNTTLNGAGITTSELLLTEGLRGSIELDGERAEIVCRSHGSINYQIELFVKNVQGSSISTSVSISSGEKLEIGSIIRDLRNQGRDLSISNGVDYSTQKGKSSDRYELMVK